MQYGDVLRNLRNSKGMSQQEFADRININRSTYARYETSSTQPDYDTLQKIADFYEVSIDYLLGRTEIPNVNNPDDEKDKSFYISKIATEFPDIELMFKDMESLSGEDMQEVYEYIKFKKSQKKGDKK